MNRLGLLIACYLVVPSWACLAQDERTGPAPTDAESTELREDLPEEEEDPDSDVTDFQQGQSVYSPAGQGLWADYSSPSPPPPLWTFQTEAVMIKRNQNFGGPLAMRQNPVPPPARLVILEGDSLEFDYEPGARLMFGYLNGYGYLEASYLGVSEWSDSVFVTGIGNDLSAPGNLGLPGGVPDFQGADFFAAEYASQMHNIEINQFFSLSQEGPVDTSMMDGDHLYLLGGLRAMFLNEEFNLAAGQFGTPDRSVYRVKTENYLMGGQLGVRWIVRHAPWFFQSQAKVGLFGNPNYQESTITDLETGLLFRDTRAEHTNVSVIAELEFAVGYEVRPNVTLRAGYLLTWVQGISLAPDQLDFTNTPASGRELDDTSGYLAHGLTLGLIFTLP